MLKKLQNTDIKNKRVIIRCDFNVPIKDSKVLDDTRIYESLETINYCLENNASVILMSHLGRIKEEKDLEENTLEPVSLVLSDVLGRDVKFVSETHGKEFENILKNIKCGDVILIENTRYEDLDGKKESGCDLKLAKYWASFADVFVNDAFGTIHRSHASNVGIAKFIPSCIGFLVQKELKVLEELKKPEKPYVLILGGKKVNDKIGVLKKLLPKVDYLLVGGGMALTFLKAEGFLVGNSVVDYESIDFCKELLKKYEDKIVLPVDVRVNNKFKNYGKIKNVDITSINDDEIALDVGPKTAKVYKNILMDAKTVFWNGPLGVYEFSNFIVSTDAVLKFLIKKHIKTVLGGGDVVAASALLGYKDKVYHASTGGGATLEFLEGKTLPGIVAIKEGCKK